MNDARPLETTATFVRLLRPAQRRLARARLRAGLARGVEQTLWLCVAAAAIEAVGSVVCRVMGNEMPPFVHAMAAAVIVIGAATGLIPPLARMRRRPPSWQQAAERLDAAHDGHNRIATAWSLAAQGVNTPFAAAAIEQGATRLRAVCALDGGTPALPHAPRRLAPKLMPAALGIVLAGLAVTFRWMPLRQTPPSPDSRRVSVAIKPSDGERGNEEPPPKGTLPGRETATPARATTPQSGRGNAASASSDTRSLSSERHVFGAEPAAVAAAPGISGGGAAGAGASDQPRQSSEAREGPVPPRRKPRPGSKAAADSQTTAEGERSSSGTIAGGGAGSGRMVAVRNQWAQRETSITGDAQAAEDQKENEEKPAGSQQRGGVQPSLPDRTEAPSRELGINGPESDRAGTGRGGPSPAKKSRGAAALLMAVPMPDFVRGQTGPGAVAVTFEDTAPLTSPQRSEVGGPGAQRSLPESAVSRFGVPWSEAEAVRAYLVPWHGHGESEGGAAPAKPSQADRTSSSGDTSTRPAGGAPN
jgi:hypothetical protein